MRGRVCGCRTAKRNAMSRRKGSQKAESNGVLHVELAKDCDQELHKEERFYERMSEWLAQKLAKKSEVRITVTTNKGHLGDYEALRKGSRYKSGNDNRGWCPTMHDRA